MTHRVSIVPALLLGTAMWPACALAQDASSGQGERSANKADETVIVVTATGLSSALSTTKTDAPIIESPQSISIVNREEMDLRGATNVADAVSYVASVQGEPSGIDSRTDEIAVRGFGAGGFSSNNNFVDGLRLPTGGQWTRFGFDTFGIEQIEVLKGPSGALYGQVAPGGIVNLTTKMPTATSHGEFLVQGQGYTDLANWSGRIGADVGGALNGAASIQGRLVGMAESGGTQVDGVDKSRYYISPSLTWAPSADTRWTLLGQYQRDEGGSTFQFLPSTGSLYETNGGYIANDANLGEPDWNTFDRDQLLVGSFLEHKLGDALTFRNNMRYTHVDTLYRVTVLSGDTITDCSAYGDECIEGQTSGRRAVQGDGYSDGFAVDNQLEARFASGALDHTVLAGVDYFHTDWTHYRDLVTSSLVLPLWDIFDPQPRGSAGYADNLGPQVYGSATSKQTGVYLQDQIAAGSLRVTLGGRYDWSEDESTDFTNADAVTSFSTSADKFSWRAGAVYLFDNGLAPYFSYSTSFLPQVVDPSTTKDGALFVPTTGDQYEAGLRYQRGDNIYVTLGGFRITQQNTQIPDPEGELCGRRTCYVQAAETRVQGLEFEARASLPTGTTVIASASYLDAEITDSSNLTVQGGHLNQVPEYLASLFVNHKVEDGALAGLGFGGGVRYTGKGYGYYTASSESWSEIPDYALFDMFLRYDLGAADRELDGVALSLSARNLGDKRYVATCTAVSACYYGQGRVVSARLSYAW